MFLYDKIFWDDSTQEEIYETIGVPMVDHVFNGYNSCCFAYGQTGSGKTYSIFGEDDATRGLIPRSLDYLFQTIGRTSNEYKLSVSFLEMYCDQIRDLGLAYTYSKAPGHKQLENTSNWFQTLQQFKNPDTSDDGTLELREDVEGSVFVKGLSIIPVTTTEEAVEILHVYNIIILGWFSFKSYTRN